MMEAILNHEESLLDYSDGSHIEEIVRTKAKELFDVCDKEGKGFINQADLQRLHGELALDDEQLAQVFERLDQDQSGCLSFEEFCDGFGGFLGLSPSFEEQRIIPERSIKNDNLSSTDVAQLAVRDALWPLQDESSDKLESRLQVVLKELNEAKKEKEAMAQILKERSESYEKHVRQLSEEMEEQIKEDRKKTFEKEVMRERSVSSDLKNQLREKEKYLDDVMLREKMLEEQLSKLKSGKHHVTKENAQLLQLNESLAAELQTTRRELDSTLLHMEVLRQRREEKEMAERAEEEARRLDVEKKSLLTQLQILREHNRKLRDDKDEVLLHHKNFQSAIKTSTPAHKRPLATQGSNVGKYFAEDAARCEALADDLFMETVSEDGEISEYSQKLDRPNILPLDSPRPGNDQPVDPRSSVEESDSASKRRRSRTEQFYRKLSQVPDGCSSPDSNFQEDQRSIAEELYQSATKRYGGSSRVLQSPSPPDRVFKVVFVGNSGVGKTSIIHRFACKAFRPSISSTIGVDYQVKTMAVDGQQVVLQLWDTAGQERYRSITRQYFRKADGVVVVYDVTNEESFLAVRNWMQSVQEGSDPSAIILLLGNKCDVDNTTSRQVMPNEGNKLAEEYSAGFFETSAKSGINVHEAMTSLSLDLTRLEDEQKESVLSLAASEERNNRTCCSGKRP